MRFLRAPEGCPSWPSREVLVGLFGKSKAEARAALMAWLEWRTLPLRWLVKRA